MKAAGHISGKEGDFLVRDVFRQLHWQKIAHIRSIPPFLLLVLLALSACSLPSASSTAKTEASGTVTPVFAFSEAIVGPNRLAFGLMRDGSPLNDPGAKVHVKFFDLTTNTPVAGAEADAIYYGKGLPAGIYVAHARFDKPGTWGVEIQSQVTGQTEPSSLRYQLEVLPKSVAPNVGDPAISTRTLTVKDVTEMKQLSSGPSPKPELYAISLDAALKNGKPTAILFATPNYCRTAVCAPSVQVLEALQQRYADRINMIHSEVYRYPFGESARAQAEAFNAAQQAGRVPTADERHTGMSDAMIAWDLPSEPWLFLIDAKGTIVARYEGGITIEELGPDMEKLVSRQ